MENRILFTIIVCCLIGEDFLTYRPADATCVLNSDFGFTLDCAFRKSGLFRVRNLGGIKAHVGLGFTVGDELGLGESLSNVEGNRRRSTSGQIPPENVNQRANRIIVRNLAPPPNNDGVTPVTSKNVTNQKVETNKKTMRQAQIIRVPVSSSAIPPFRPIPPKEKVEYAIFDKTVSIRRQPIVESPIPHFQAIPHSISRISDNLAPSINSLSTSDKIKPAAMAIIIPAQSNKDQYLQSNKIPMMSYNYSQTLSPIEANILQKQQQLKQKLAMENFVVNSPSTTTPRSSFSPLRSTTTQKYPLVGPSKVMNAPREYYPVGYDKNYDDNFSSRVELPETTFYCGDQKHFPGLYADEDLGCMVFHVCALTDDGLIMKSFLCPESTLFDQTILKCNWWFYVECKNSKKLYDTNIPISKSYQLMKALTFFSSLKKDTTPSSTAKPEEKRSEKV